MWESAQLMRVWVVPTWPKEQEEFCAWLETLPGQPSGVPTAFFQLRFTELRELQIHVGGTDALRCNINFLVQMWTKRMSPKDK